MIKLTKNNSATLPIENDSEIFCLTSQLRKLTKKKFTGKKMPSLEEQLSDL